MRTTLSEPSRPRRRPRTPTGRSTTCLLTVAVSSVCASLSSGQQIRRISVGNEGVQASVHSGWPSLSAAGHQVAFESGARLTADGARGERQVFVRDIEQERTLAVSVDSAGAPADGYSIQPSISGDGRLVVFESIATNLVPDDTNEVSDVFLHDRRDATTTRLSLEPDGGELDGRSSEARISGNGAFVTFTSRATKLAPGGSKETANVFLLDLLEGRLSCVSTALDGGPANGWSQDGHCSDDGKLVLFASEASNLVAGDSNGAWDCFVRDRKAGVIRRVSVSSQGAEAESGCFPDALTPDGRFLTFHSRASNLVPGDDNDRWDVFLHDLNTGHTELVSAAANGRPANGHSRASSLSADGRFVVFASEASNLDATTDGEGVDIFLLDRRTRRTTCLSRTPTMAADGASEMPVISADGGVIAFRSAATNLVDADTNGVMDIFVRERPRPGEPDPN